MARRDWFLTRQCVYIRTVYSAGNCYIHTHTHLEGGTERERERGKRCRPIDKRLISDRKEVALYLENFTKSVVQELAVEREPEVGYRGSSDEGYFF